MRYKIAIRRDGAPADQGEQGARDALSANITGGFGADFAICVEAFET